MSNTIKVGDRVESEVVGVSVEGTIKSIYVQTTGGGPAPMYKVAIDKRGGVESDVEEVDTPAHRWRTPGSEKPCVDCGEFHNAAKFSLETQELFAAYQVANESDKTDILTAIGESFLNSFQEYDLQFPESVHDLADQVDEAQQALDNKLRKIGRIAVSYMQQELRQKSAQDLLKNAMVALMGGGGSLGQSYGDLPDFGDDPDHGHGKKPLN
jgi:hypothetical protein